MEIGKKKLRKDGTVVDLWGAYGRVFTNGHKQFTSDQVKAVNELQSHEERYRENFKTLRHIMTVPRNPLAGDATPRQDNGDVVLNPNAHGTNIHGYPLFPPGHEAKYKKRPQKKLTTGQIGVPDHKYLILGNVDEDIMGASAQPVDLIKKTQEEFARKSAAKSDQNEFVRSQTEVKVRRQQVKLAQTLAKMKIEMSKKERELEFLRSGHGL
jgi:hypothetical protein